MGGERGPGRERGNDDECERGRRCFGEQTEHDSSEQLLTELLERELRGCLGGGDGGRFDLGKILPRCFVCKLNGERRLLLPGDVGVRLLRISIGDLGDRGDLRLPIGGSGGDLGRLRISGERGLLLPTSGDLGRLVTGAVDSGVMRRNTPGERLLNGGDDGGVLRLRERLRDRL